MLRTSKFHMKILHVHTKISLNGFLFLRPKIALLFVSPWDINDDDVDHHEESPSRSKSKVASKIK